jgi:carbamate kinase
MILTAVEKVAINFGKPGERWLSSISINEAKRLIQEGHFSAGSMLPKVEAAVEFASSGENRYSIITLLEKAREGIRGKTGTIIK